MKFCYIDETKATENDRVTIATGIVVDSHRGHVTRQNWDQLLEKMSLKAGRTLSELHTSELYAGKGQWSRVQGSERALVIEEIVDWFLEREHHITFSAILPTGFNTRKKECFICQGLGNSLTAAYFHVLLSIQKKHQQEQKAKGHTVVVIDEGDEKVVSLVLDPPEWSSSYYAQHQKAAKSKPKKKEVAKQVLNQIIDVPFFANSKHAKLLQIADLTCFILKRYVELEEFKEDEKYVGERARILSWVEKLKMRLYPSSCRYPKTRRCQTADVFWELAPHSLRILG